jgi:hypothetical protein
MPSWSSKEPSDAPRRPRPVRPVPKPTTITECARRYHACALALAQTLGLSLAEVLAQHRESVTAVYIESSKCEVRLRASVTLPPLATPNGQGERPPEASNRAIAEAIGVSHTTVDHDVNDGNKLPPSAIEAPESQAAGGHKLPPEPEPAVEAEGVGVAEPPTTIPPGLPCGGQAVADLRPAQLRMLLSRVDQLAADQGRHWRPLLEALAAERQRRIEAGRRPRPTLVQGEG